jgi:hypothetical protein
MMAIYFMMQDQNRKIIMIKYRYNVKFKSNNYKYGGHVHNLIEKAYQGHSFGGSIHDSSNIALRKIKDHLPSLSSEVISDQIKKIPEHIQSGVKEIPKLINHGMKLAQELAKKHFENN